MGGILNFIRRNKNGPFFIYFPTQVPHGRSPQDGDQIQLPEIGPYAVVLESSTGFNSGGRILVWSDHNAFTNSYISGNNAVEAEYLLFTEDTNDILPG